MAGQPDTPEVEPLVGRIYRCRMTAAPHQRPFRPGSLRSPGVSPPALDEPAIGAATTRPKWSRWRVGSPAVARLLHPDSDHSAREARARRACHRLQGSLTEMAARRPTRPGCG